MRQSLLVTLILYSSITIGVVIISLLTGFLFRKARQADGQQQRFPLALTFLQMVNVLLFVLAILGFATGIALNITIGYQEATAICYGAVLLACSSGVNIFRLVHYMNNRYLLFAMAVDLETGHMSPYTNLPYIPVGKFRHLAETMVSGQPSGSLSRMLHDVALYLGSL